jgi:glycosyltransferase involved in cell wall biosynthesis
MGSTNTSKMADICLILEGTYPYARGGVSEWAHLLIKGLPDVTFHLWCIISTGASAKPAYELPPNVLGVTNVPLFEELEGDSGEPLSPRFWEIIKKMHQKNLSTEERGKILFEELAQELPRNRGDLPLNELLFGDKSYERLQELYDENSITLSYMDYFYTYLYTHLPLFRLLAVPIPQARVYHAIATGYAGFLGCKARRDTGRPLLLTEHGLYTNERHIEIVLSTWIYTLASNRIQIGSTSDSLKRIWLDIFNFLGKLTYNESSRIITLSQANKDMQLRLGAQEEKLEIIPNGVQLDRFGSLMRANTPGKPVVGLVGRVVPIKDVRTFVKACRTVANRFPEARFLVMGGTESDPMYYQNCLDYRRLLGLDDVLTFTGDVDVTKYYPLLDVVVLTSVSEGLPLTVLEAMACGTPVVCTRVGCCEELLQGRQGADRRIGRSGFVENVGDHKAIGEAIIKILANPGLARRMGKAGRRRVVEFYNLDVILSTYSKLYNNWLAASGAN